MLTNPDDNSVSVVDIAPPDNSLCSKPAENLMGSAGPTDEPNAEDMCISVSVNAISLLRFVCR
jgi:hypothetical protein